MSNQDVYYENRGDGGDPNAATEAEYINSDEDNQSENQGADETTIIVPDLEELGRSLVSRKRATNPPEYSDCGITLFAPPNAPNYRVFTVTQRVGEEEIQVGEFLSNEIGNNYANGILGSLTNLTFQCQIKNYNMNRPVKANPTSMLNSLVIQEAKRLLKLHPEFDGNGLTHQRLTNAIIRHLKEFQAPTAFNVFEGRVLARFVQHRTGFGMYAGNFTMYECAIHSLLDEVSFHAPQGWAQDLTTYATNPLILVLLNIFNGHLHNLGLRPFVIPKEPTTLLKEPSVKDKEEHRRWEHKKCLHSKALITQYGEKLLVVNDKAEYHKYLTAYEAARREQETMLPEGAALMDFPAIDGDNEPLVFDQRGDPHIRVHAPRPPPNPVVPPPPAQEEDRDAVLASLLAQQAELARRIDEFTQGTPTSASGSNKKRRYSNSGDRRGSDSQPSAQRPVINWEDEEAGARVHNSSHSNNGQRTDRAHASPEGIENNRADSMLTMSTNRARKLQMEKDAKRGNRPRGMPKRY